MATKPKAATAAKTAAKPEESKKFTTATPDEGTVVATIRAADFIEAIGMLKRIPAKSSLFEHFTACYLLRFIAKSAKEQPRWIAVATDGHVIAEDVREASGSQHVNKSATWIVDAAWLNGALRFIASLKLDKMEEISIRVASASRMEIVAGDCSFIAPSQVKPFPDYNKIFDEAISGTPTKPASFNLRLLDKLTIDGGVALDFCNVSDSGESQLYLVRNVIELRGVTRRAAIMPIKAVN